MGFKIAGLPKVVANSTEELNMWKKLTYCLAIVLFSGALMAPASFAAQKYEVSASETFDPLGFSGAPIGYYVSPPVVKCPGSEPTGDPAQPCPVGSRTHLRDAVWVSRVDSTDRQTGSGVSGVVVRGGYRCSDAPSLVVC